MGTFMTKEVLMEEAERLGVADQLEGLTWPQKQKVVLDAKKALGEDIHYSTAKVERKAPVDKDYWLCHEIDSIPIQRIKYDEELGNDIETEEVSFDLKDANQMVRSATYRTRSTNRKVIAQSTAPKENCGVIYNETKVTLITTWRGRRGYIFHDMTFDKDLGQLLIKKFGTNTFKGIKSLLIESGYWGDYEKEINDPRNNYTWYAANKVLSIDINKTESIMRDIEKKYAKNRVLYGE